MKVAHILGHADEHQPVEDDAPPAVLSGSRGPRHGSAFVSLDASSAQNGAG